MVENQAFHSVLQLAVAMNVGFAAVVAFRGNTITREKEKVESLFENAKLFRDISISENKNNAKSKELFKKIVELKNEVVREVDDFDNSIFTILRWAAVFCAFFSFVLLVYASFAAKDSADAVLVAGSIILNLPIFFYIFYIFVRTVRIIAPMKKRRIELDMQVSKEFLSIL